jgi:hypothetical protein
MPPSVLRLRLQAYGTVVKTAIKHFTSRNYPPEWNLAFHIQLAVLRRLDESSLESTVEEVRYR